MTMSESAQSDVGALRRVLVKRVEDAFRSRDSIERQWRDLNYLAAPDFSRAVAEQADANRLTLGSPL